MTQLADKIWIKADLEVIAGQLVLDMPGGVGWSAREKRKDMIQSCLKNVVAEYVESRDALAYTLSFYMAKLIDAERDLKVCEELLEQCRTDRALLTVAAQTPEEK